MAFACLVPTASALFAPTAHHYADCFNARPTLTGTPRDDRLIGTPGRDVIVGGRGNDVISGRGGDDLICGRRGADRIYGGGGDDRIGGGSSADLIVGGDGDDELWGRPGRDELRGNAGRDELWAGQGVDSAHGGKGRDRCGAETMTSCNEVSNRAPTARGDTYTIAEDGLLTRPSPGVLGDDTDPDGDALTALLGAAPTHGNVSLQPNGSFTYNPDPNYFGPDSFTYRADDGPARSAPATVSLTVTPVDDSAVVVTSSTPSASFTEDGAAVVVDSAATLTDVDSTHLSSVTATITNGFVANEDELFLPAPPPGIVPTYDSGTGVLTLTGSATLADYQAALRAIEFDSTSQAPGTTRTIEFGAGTTTGERNLTVQQVNDAPVNTTPGPQAFDEDDPQVFSTANGNALAVDDVDAGSDPVKVTLTATHGVLTLNSLTGLTFTTGDGSADAVHVFSGAIGDINPALDGMVFTPATEYSGPADITIDSDDLGNTGTGGAQTDSDTVSMTIAAMNDAPVNTVPGSQALDEDTTKSFGLSVADADAASDDVDVTIDVLHGTLDVAATTATLTGDGTGTVNLVGTLSEVNAGLASVIYAPTSQFNGSDTLTVVSSDLGHNGGPAQSDTDNVSITVNPINDAPIADDETFSGNDSAHGNTTLLVNDPSDSSPTVVHPHTTISGDILAGDTDADGPALTVTPGTLTTNDGGSVVLESDGDFVYEPAASTSCTDTSDFFDYTVEDSGTPELTDTGRVTIAIAGCVWYVSNNATGNSGTSQAPFDTLAQAETASGVNHTVFVFDGDNTSTGYNAGGYAMDSGERLIGEHEGLVVDPDQGAALTADTLHPANPGAHPTITAVNADVVDLDDGNEIRGFNIDPQGTGGGIFGGAGDTGGATIDDVNIAETVPIGTQAGLELNGTTGTFNISSFIVDNDATGVLLTNAGTVDFAGDTGHVFLDTNLAPALVASNTDLGTSHLDAIRVSNSSNGGVDLDTTTGAITLGDGVGDDLNLTTTAGSEPALDLNSAGSVTVAASGINQLHATGGPALDVTDTAGATLAFDDVDSTNSSTDGINLDGLGTGTFSAGVGSSISGAAGIAFDVNGGSGLVDYDGTIANGEGTTADITGRSGNTNLDGAITDTGDADAVQETAISLSGNTAGTTSITATALTLNTGEDHGVVMASSDGHTLTLSGGSLNIDTTSGKGIEADTSGTIEASGTGNTLDTTTGRALNISDTDIANGDVTFQRISSNGSANGIRLNNSANAGGALVVVGAGGTCTSADPSGCSGGVIQNSVDTAVLLNAVAGPVTLTRMNLVDSANDGIGATSASGGLTMVSSRVHSNGDASGDSGLDATNLTGTVAMTDVQFTSNVDNNVAVTNAAGTMNLNVTGAGTLNSGAGGDGISVTATGSGNHNLNVQGGSYATNAGDHIQHISDAANTSDNDVTVTATTMTSPAAPAPGTCALGIRGIVVEHGGTSTTDATLTNNNIQNACVGAISVGTTGTVVDQQSAQVDAIIENNTIGTTGIAGSGSVQGHGIFVDSNGNGRVRTRITGNAVRQWTNHSAIFLDVVDGDAEMDATIKNNSMQSANSAFAGSNTRGMTIHLGLPQPGDSIDACLDIGDQGNTALMNSLAGTGESPQTDLRYFHEGPGSVVRLVGYSGVTNPAIGTIASWFQTRNSPSGTPTVSGIGSTPGPPAPSLTQGAASCQEPSG